MGHGRRGAWLLTAALLALLAAGCRAPLLEGLDEPQANDLIVALSDADIDADKRGRMGRFTVEVAPGDFAAAWRIARAAGLPRGSTDRVALFGRSEHRDAEAMRADQLGRLLRTDPAIADARVVLGRRGAAVSVRAREPADIQPQRIAARIRAVAGLGAHDPVAVDVHHAPTPAVASTTGAMPAARTGPPAALWFASAAVVLMLIGCGLLWRRARPPEARPHA